MRYLTSVPLRSLPVVSRSQHGVVTRSVLWGLLVSILLISVTWGYIERSHLFPRTGLPAFDFQRASQLTAEKRRSYELELYSELQQWNMGSRRYPTVENIQHREARWMEMAADGFELAHITLRVLKPSAGAVYSMRGPLERLEELAVAGDVGAMCLMPGLVNVAAIRHDWRPYLAKTRQWLFKGASLGHPQCLKELGARFLRGSPGFEKDIPRGLDLEFAARSAGYSHDVGALILHFKDKGSADLNDVRRHYCWGGIHEGLWLDDRSKFNLQSIEVEAHNSGRVDLAQLVSELKVGRYTLNDCIRLGKGI